MPNDKWWDESYNPFWGCSNNDEICAVRADCWARAIVRRFYYGQEGAVWRGDDLCDRRIVQGQVVGTPILEVPLTWRKPRFVFYASMSDLYCEIISPLWRERAERVITDCPRHTFMALTKRPDRITPIIRMENDVRWEAHPHNLWLGVSVCRASEITRIHTLREKWPGVRFVSFEPLMDAISDWSWLSMVDWVIIGGRSGPHPLNVNTDPAMEERVFALMDRCCQANVPVWLKNNLKLEGGVPPQWRQRPPHSLRR